MASTDSQIQLRAARGAAHLDRTLPGWETEIDLGRLDLSEAEAYRGSPACVLCQLSQMRGNDAFGSYTHGMVVAGVEDSAQVDLGFEVERYDSDDRLLNAFEVNAEYRQLTAAWTAEVERRLRARFGGLRVVTAAPQRLAA